MEIKTNLGLSGKSLSLDLDLKDHYDKAFLYVLIASLALRVAWLDSPPGSLIFDER